MSEHQHEDPVAHASTKITSYVSLVAMAAEAVAQVSAARARERAAVDERAAHALRAERQAAYAQARLGWAPILDSRTRERTSVRAAGTVWAWAQAWRPDPEAERASQLAEDRLREIRPDVMDRYDRLCEQGITPIDAMRRVAPFFDQPPARTGQAAPDRAVLTEQDTARRAADAELTLYRGESAVVDDPRTEQVDEGGEAVAQATPHLSRAAGEDAKARSLRATTDRSLVAIAGEGYPKPIDAASVGAAHAASVDRPTSTSQQRTAAAQQATAGRGR